MVPAGNPGTITLTFTESRQVGRAGDRLALPPLLACWRSGGPATAARRPAHTTLRPGAGRRSVLAGAVIASTPGSR